MTIQIRRVNALPVVLEPSTLYFIKDIGSGKLSIFATDEAGSSVFSNVPVSINEQEFQLLLQSYIDQPNGVAGVGNDSMLSTAIGFNGQDTPILGPTADYLWDDNVSMFIEKNYGGANNPTFGTYFGNFQGILFSASTMQQVWCDFHVKHDWAMGTAQYLHVHWLPTTNQAGTVRWGVEYMVAKGHGQEAFTNPVTIYIEQAVAANQLGQHMVAECTALDAIPGTGIEPDTFIKTRVFRDAAHANDTYPALVHAWCLDLHYQKGQLGTVNKAPNFFGTP